MSAFGGKADITETFENVCFLAQSGHKQVRSVAVQTDPETPFRHPFIIAAALFFASQAFSINPPRLR